MPQVRAIATSALKGIQQNGLDVSQKEDSIANGLMQDDIKRFLERPAAPITAPTTMDAPPGAPIGGDTGMDWLARPRWCDWVPEIGGGE
jgi:hypothetical protein